MKSPGNASGYTLYHPRWYRIRVSTYWWLQRWAYLKFVLREISSIFVAFFVSITLLQIRALAHGPHAYGEFQAFMKNPLVLSLNAISFFFVVFHALTWFSLAPRAMPLRIRGKPVPESLISGVNYAAWLGLSAVVTWFVLGG